MTKKEDKPYIVADGGEFSAEDFQRTKYERVYVYIAGPYSVGDLGENTHNAIHLMLQLVDMGMYPFCPHASAVVANIVSPRGYKTWMPYDLGWLAKCDVLLRLPGESPGADVEVYEAGRLRIPVIHLRGGEDDRELVSLLEEALGG